MISRHWNGLLKKGKEDEYMAFLKSTVFKEMERLPGFVSAQILHREAGEGTDFMIITEWENMDAIRQFAGENTETAVVEDYVRERMIRFDHKVRHYKVDHKTR